MTILEILDDFESENHIHKDDLISESARTPGLFSKYHKMYRIVKIVRLDIKKKLTLLLKDKYEYYSGKAPDEVYKKHPFGFKFKTKEAIMRYVKSDAEVSDMFLKLKTLEEKEDTLKTIMDQINQRSYLINNCNKTMEFFNGDS